MLSDERFNELGLAVARGEITQEEASALVRQAVLEGGAATLPPPTSSAKNEPKAPWADKVATDKRIPLEQVADFIRRTEGVSQEDALRRAIRTPAEDAAPLAAEEAKRFAERAELEAKRDWMTSPEGIEAMGRERQAKAAADAERAAAMKIELEVRGIPVGDASTEEILGIVDGMAAEKAAVAEANDLQANIATAMGGEGQ
jgi:hypothetical protein